MKTLLLAALVLGACIPEPTNAPAPAPEGVERMRRVARDVLDSPPIDDLEIRWFSGECLEGLDGFGDSCHPGVSMDTTFGPVIYVLAWDPIWQTALAHELMHRHFALQGNAYANHDRADWEQLERAINDRTRENDD